jgi:hypothetical protein
LSFETSFVTANRFFGQSCELVGAARVLIQSLTNSSPCLFPPVVGVSVSVSGTRSALDFVLFQHMIEQMCDEPRSLFNGNYPTRIFGGFVS